MGGSTLIPLAPIHVASEYITSIPKSRLHIPQLNRVIMARIACSTLGWIGAPWRSRTQCRRQQVLKMDRKTHVLVVHEPAG
jgi:hypothetical protein